MWTNTDPAEISKGKLQNVSVSSSGKFTLSPDKRRADGILASYVWCLVADGTDSLFAGTGNPGTVFKASHNGNIEEYFKTPELHVQSLTIDSAGNIFAGTLPNGRIYKISSKGQGEVFCKLPVPYIWDIISDNCGNLYAATGNSGDIYKISDKGIPILFFDSPFSNILDLVIDDDGNVYACSEPEGIIYKITPNGNASVLYDADEDEVHCLAIDKNGVVYAGTSSGTPPLLRAPAPPVLPKVQLPLLMENFPGEPSDVWLNNFLSENDIETAASTFMEEGYAENGMREVPVIPEMNNVYRIDKDGRVRKIFAAEGFILCLAIDYNNDVIVGTGNKAALFKIDSNNGASLLYDFSESQVLEILSYKNGINYIATGNNANIYQLSSSFSREGTYESVVHDTTYISSWGCISWKGKTPPQTNIILSTRSGNNRRPDITWSDWAQTHKSKVVKVKSPSARFIQYRATLLTNDSNVTPSLENVSIAYLPQNQPPIIRRVEVTAPSHFPDDIMENSNTLNVPETVHSGPDDLYLDSSRKNQKAASNEPRKLISWDAEDPNNDRLEFDLEFKSVDESKWKNLKKNVKEVNELYWNINRIPDGYYQAKVIACDSLDNPLEFALHEDIESESFLIDNTRPVVLNLKTVVQSNTIDKNGRAGHTIIVSGTARDAMCNITDIQYSIDSGEWQTTFPEDKIFDSMEETFIITIPYISADEHTIVINALDYEGNIGSSRIVFNP
ncbi:hypothetical protein SCALIN_C04_0185 [Candidatus Scalindua japonica]|uniref:Uncharacterized protein n=1 Tax=Candidatus Scalindua japonica TaxID=1284222 RepID=A0A286TUX6_9BACT|nr:hypothetical protein [Candidatus Scalindua japonica]GAX59697.1 hypothetical protein SCALIN_C04_0185 [Candidatus Scalindua japonica]